MPIDCFSVDVAVATVQQKIISKFVVNYTTTIMVSHQYSIEELFELLDTSANGLTQAQAAERLARHGANELIEKQGKSLLGMFLDQFKDFMIIVLLLAAIISGVLGDVVDSIAIVVIVIINAVIGVYQEFKAEKAMAALRKMAAQTATVLRDSNVFEIPAREIVLGDVVILEAGRVVPADIRLTFASQLYADEAALTGESVTVEKHTTTIADELIPLGDRHNMVFKGTNISAGRGTGVVVATGMNTELGKIAGLLQDEEEVKTPLQKRLKDFGRKLAGVIMIVCIVVFAVGLLRGEETLLMFLTTISLAVAAIPEALPAVVTIALSLSAKRMITRHALIRKLPAVETLGSVTYICSDKTGTLTQQNMTAQQVYWNNLLLHIEDIATPTFASSDFATALAVSNDVALNSDGTFSGEQTEVGLYKLCATVGLNKQTLEHQFPRVAELPFDSVRKCMTTIHKTASGFVSFTKGAPDLLIAQCSTVAVNSEVLALDRTALLQANESMASNGLRVMAVAMQHWDVLPPELNAETLERNCTLLGLVGLIDPPRPEAKEAVALCKQAGIIPVMITGDHPLTATAIAKHIGIVESDNDIVLHAGELEQMQQDELTRKVDAIRVYARVAPEQKLRIVKALQERGHFVAMTGDGVNDAPALKRSDIGIAMGINGTDVSKEAADMILVDDNFATIVNAIHEGRRVFDNISKFIKYSITGNTGKVLTIFLAPLFGLPMPLIPIQILWINLVTDGLPGLALAAEPAETDIMKRKPRHPTQPIFTKGMAWHIVFIGTLLCGIAIVTQSVLIKHQNPHWQTIVFTLLCFSQMGQVLAVRSGRDSIFTLGLFSNTSLVWAIVSTIVLQLCTIYIPFIQGIFHTQALTWQELIGTMAVSSLVFIAVEIEKMFRRKGLIR